MNQHKKNAQGLASLGRGKDTALVHMTPGEVHGLQGLALAHGGSLTINPKTGLPEAGFLSDILPGLAAAAAIWFTAGAAAPAVIGTAGAAGAGAGAAGLASLGTAAAGTAGLAGAGAAGLGATTAGLTVAEAAAAAELAAAGTAGATATAAPVLGTAGADIAANTAIQEGLPNLANVQTPPASYWTQTANINPNPLTMIDASAVNSGTVATAPIGDVASQVAIDTGPSFVGDPAATMQTPSLWDKTWAYAKKEPIRAASLGMMGMGLASSLFPAKPGKPSKDDPGWVRPHTYDQSTQRYTAGTPYRSMAYAEGGFLAIPKPFMGEGPEFDLTKPFVGPNAADTVGPDGKDYAKGGPYANTKGLMEQLNKLSPTQLSAQTKSNNPIIAGMARLLQNSKKGAGQGAYAKDIYAEMAGGGGIKSLTRGKTYADGGDVPTTDFGNRYANPAPVSSEALDAYLAKLSQPSIPAAPAVPRVAAAPVAPLPFIPGAEPQSQSGLWKYDPATQSYTGPPPPAPVVDDGGGGGMGESSGDAAGGSIKALAAGGLGSLQGTYAAGGKLLRGPGDGVSDSIPAVIQGEKPQRAALADGEFVVDARTVSEIGNGSTEAGARKLYAMMDRIHARRKKVGIGKDSRAETLLPA